MRKAHFFDLCCCNSLFLLLLSLGLLLSFPLQAQVLSPPSYSVESQENQYTSIRNFQPWLQYTHATGSWFGLRDRLYEKGIDLGFSSIDEVWGNTTGGFKRGSVYTGLLQGATDIDLEKLLHWQGARFYSRWLYLSGQDPGISLTGDLFYISNIAGYSTFRNVELWLEQKFFDETISLRAGQLVADSEFVISNYGALFINNTFGWPAFISSNIPNGGPAYPIGAPGVRLKLKPTDQCCVMAAAFQGNVFAQNINNHGFDWNLNAEQGYFYLTEVSHRYQFILPGEIKAGA